MAGSQLVDPLNDFSFLHLQQPSRTVFTQHDLAQGRRTLVAVFAVPPVMKEEGEELLRNSLFPPEIERVERLPLTGGVRSLAECADQAQHGHRAVEMVFPLVRLRQTITVEKYLPVLPQRDGGGGSRRGVRFSLKSFHHL